VSDPITKFKQWWHTAVDNSPLQQKNAVCVSTINQQGFPEGRFVDLKAVDKQGFVFCTYLDSNKGKHIENNPKIAITCWWDHVGLQVRVLGHAKSLCDSEASEYWQARNKEAQITTLCCEQSKTLNSESQLLEMYRAKYEQLHNIRIEKPHNWGGYLLEPVSIEFLTFRENRLHLREWYRLEGLQWYKSLLQP
jgi:pyridoxamine 5'-phosphate oxidase